LQEADRLGLKLREAYDDYDEQHNSRHSSDNSGSECLAFFTLLALTELKHKSSRCIAALTQQSDVTVGTLVVSALIVLGLEACNLEV
jgi:hypothetical protein